MNIEMDPKEKKIPGKEIVNSITKEVKADKCTSLMLLFFETVFTFDMNTFIEHIIHVTLSAYIKLCKEELKKP